MAGPKSGDMLPVQQEADKETLNKAREEAQKGTSISGYGGESILERLDRVVEDSNNGGN